MSTVKLFKYEEFELSITLNNKQLMERFKLNQGRALGFVRHQKMKSEQLSKDNSYCLGTSRPMTASNSSIKQVVIVKHPVQRTRSGGNNSINLDLSKISSVQIPNNKNNSARNLDHRRANSIYLAHKGKVDGGTDRNRKENIPGNEKLVNAPDVAGAGVSRFWERLSLAENKLHYFYNCLRK